MIASADSKEESSQTQSSNKQKQSYPKVLKNIPAISGSANHLIKYSIIDVLYSYAYLMRLYNGEPEENLHHFVFELYELANSLSKNLTFHGVELAVHNALNTVQEHNNLWNSQEFSYKALLDVCKVLSGKHVIDGESIDYVDCALSDICRLFSKAKKVTKCKKGDDKQDQKKVFLAKKKVEFFLSWAQSNKKVLHEMVPELKAIHFELMSDCKRHDKEKKKIDSSIRKMMNKQKLIQEL